MAVLTNAQLIAVRRAIVEELAKTGPATLTKAQFDAATSATNAWIDANLNSYLSYLAANAPEAANAWNASQKAQHFALVVMSKYGRL